MNTLDQIKARLDKATPGPWFRQYSDVVSNRPDPRSADHYDDPSPMRISRGPEHLDKRDRQGIADAEFIAHAPEDIARLIAAAERALSLADHFDGVIIDHGNGVTEDVGETLQRTITSALEP